MPLSKTVVIVVLIIVLILFCANLKRNTSNNEKENKIENVKENKIENVKENKIENVNVNDNDNDNEVYIGKYNEKTAFASSNNLFDFMLEISKINITPKLKILYGLTDEQCEQVYAGIFILSSIKKNIVIELITFKVNEEEIQRFMDYKRNMCRLLTLTKKEEIFKHYGSETICRKIVDLVKIPSYKLDFPEKYRYVVNIIISELNTNETILRRLILGGKYYNIVETIIASVPELFTIFLQIK
ncbi:hypothetical protein NGRA_3249 [Nosema granulosis]|uniref:Uncharacterized protein n=1 Tax=Nosema granulosis TaxID=83296 RepID=A0A9P6KXP1_9MICR|nr:hypothetical protein NGRA_3249 [Nosema granulosis]